MSQVQNSLTGQTASQVRAAHQRHNIMALLTKSLNKATQDYEKARWG